MRTTMKFLQTWLLSFVLLLCAVPLHAQLVKTKRTNADELLDQATIQFNNKNYYKCIQLSRQGLSKRPDYPDLHFLLGRAYAQVGQYDSARLEFQIVLHDVPRYREAYSQACNLELKQKRYQEALCYMDDALYFFPNDREFMLKKLAILEDLKYYKYSDAYASRLITKYPEDSTLLRYYLSYKIDHAALYLRQGNIARARYEYDKVLEVDPGNRDAIDAIYNLEIKSGNYENSLAYINRLLLTEPNNYEYLLKKMAILEELRRYPEAIEISNRIITLYPSDRKIRGINQELRMAAGRFYMNTDPYMQFQSVLEQSPSNRDALNYVTGIAYSRGLYQECLFWCNRALRYYPSDRDFINKKIASLESLEKFGAAADLAERVWMGNRTTANLDRFVELKIQSAKGFMADLEMDSALIAFNRILELSPSNPIALNYAINILAGQKKYDQAVAVVDKSLTFYPDDQFLLFKKANIVSEAERYEESETILFDLLKRYPDNDRYFNGFVDLKLTNGRALVKNQDYDEARDHFKTVLALQPQNMEAITPLINVEISTKNYDSALVYINQGIEITPNDKELYLKKSGVLEVLNRHKEAYAITGDLWRKYPYNTKIRDIYADQIAASARYNAKRGRVDVALQEYEKVLAIIPKDTLAIAASANLLAEKQELDKALYRVDSGLHYYPGNEALTFKRATLLERLAEAPENKSYRDSLFGNAFLAADSVAKMKPWNADYVDYANYLKSKTFKNMVTFGVLLTTIDFDNNRTRANIATIQYMRIKRWGSWAVRFNYAGRFIGTGLQLEGDINYVHSKKAYSYGNVGFANDIVFPNIRLGYSYYRTVAKNVDAEIGVRALRFNSFDLTSISFVGGVAKTWNDFYANFRTFLIFMGGNTYATASISARQYLNSTDYIGALFGIGNSPDDFSTNFQLPTFAGIATYNIGVSYQKVFLHRNTLGISAAWYNQRFDVSKYRNQYDIFLTFSRKF